VIGSTDCRSFREAAAFTSAARCAVGELDPLTDRLGSADASSDTGWLPTKMPAATNDAATATRGRLCHCRGVVLCLLRALDDDERLVSTVGPLAVAKAPCGER